MTPLVGARGATARREGIVRWIGIVCASLVCVSLVPAGCKTTATGENGAKPAQKPRPQQTIAERISLARWQIALTAEVAYRDTDPQKRRAFIDLHAERVAIYLVLREHEHDADPAATSAVNAAIREIRSMRSPEAAAYCASNPDPVCAFAK
jgi:hypothetical protein